MTALDREMQVFGEATREDRLGSEDSEGDVRDYVSDHVLVKENNPWSKGNSCRESRFKF